MPLYDYICNNCNKDFELALPLSDYNKEQTCPDCKGTARKIIVIGHGGIQGDHPAWLNHDVISQLQDTDNPNTRLIESRPEYNRYLKENGIIEDLAAPMV